MQSGIMICNYTEHVDLLDTSGWGYLAAVLSDQLVLPLNYALSAI